MSNSPQFSTKRSIEEVKEQYSIWRKNRKSQEAIPKDLWEAAVELSPEYSVNVIAKTLSLSYIRLKESIKTRAKEKKANEIESEITFVQLKPVQPKIGTSCEIEIQNRLGCKMKIRFEGETGLNVMELSQK